MAVVELVFGYQQTEDEKRNEWRRAYVWAGDYRNGAVASLMAALKVRTFGDIEQLGYSTLLAAGLDPGEISKIRAMLTKRGLDFALQVVQ